MKEFDQRKVAPHPTSIIAKEDKARDRENLARQMRTSQMMRELARENINAVQVIDEIKEINLKLKGEQDTAGNDIPLDPDLRRQYEARYNLQFKLLDKVLPSPKATESTNLNLHEHAGTINLNKVSDVELAQRLQLWRKNHGAGHVMRATQKESCVEATFHEVEASENDERENTKVFDFL